MKKENQFRYLNSFDQYTEGKYNTGILSSVLHKNKTCAFCAFISPIYTFSSAGNIFVYTPSQGTNREKYFIHYHIKVKYGNSGGK